jgi:hypothetical protein
LSKGTVRTNLGTGTRGRWCGGAERPEGFVSANHLRMWLYAVTTAAHLGPSSPPECTLSSPSSWLRHSKHFTVDEHVAVPELVDLAIVRRMRVVEDAYRAVSRELTKQEWSKRIMGLRYVDSMIHLTPALQ